MAGELNIQDEQFANELLSQPLPMAFIDFEAFVPTIPGIVPGVTPTTTIPCQWSSHTIYEHGLGAADDMTHGEYLWTGDRGWNPIYSFVQSLYNETADCQTIAIYTNYEITCLNNCKEIAAADMERWEANSILDGYFALDENGMIIPLANFYVELLDWLDDPYEFPIEDDNGHSMDLSDISRAVYSWRDAGAIDYNFLVVNGYGEKVPLMEIAPQIEGWCDSMLSRFYDLCYGPINSGRGGGVKTWLQSPEFHNSNSIKYVLPPAIKEYSRSEELLVSQGLPANGYEGLRAMGQIARGDECTTIYLRCLDRPVRPGVPMSAEGHAEFDANIENQCLVYCCLDTLSMVMIYLAVLEATERWADRAYNEWAEFARFDDDGLFHFIEIDGDNQVFYKGCDENHEVPYDFATELEIVPEADLANMPIREQYGSICPKCRRLRNLA